MKLVIVETPSQAKTLTDVLGEGWRIEPCNGFVRALPTDTIGVDVNDDFRPTFTVASGKGNLVRRLMKAIRESAAVYAATPPGRVGEAMAWHVLALSPDAKDKLIYRVSLRALTPDAIRAAFAALHPLDMNRIEAEMTGRMVDRLVGWSVNAAASKALGFKTALTYDGMIALRLLVERDRQIAAFTPETRWRASVEFQSDGVPFTAQVLNAKGAPLALRSADQATQLETLLKPAAFWVDKTGQALKSQPAPGALTLHSLIETAARELGLSPERTLALVATLYEAGWITHPDSEALPEASEAAKAYIRREYGTDYVAPDAVVTAAIAPADVNRVPEDLPGDGAALYRLIWHSFVAAHISPAQDRITAARILVGASRDKLYPLELRVQGRVVYFDGGRRILKTTNPDDMLPLLKEGAPLQPTRIAIESVTTEPLDCFTEGTLAVALAQIGLAAPSAARAIVQLEAAGYVTAEIGMPTLTESGRVVADYITATVADLTAPEYAAELTADIERIAVGERARIDVLRAFWSRFGDALHPVPAQRVVGEHKPIVLRPAEEV